MERGSAYARRPTTSVEVAATAFMLDGLVVGIRLVVDSGQPGQGIFKLMGRTQDTIDI